MSEKQEQELRDTRKNLLEELESLPHDLPQIPGSIKQAEVIMSWFEDMVSSKQKKLKEVETQMREKEIKID